MQISVSCCLTYCTQDSAYCQVVAKRFSDQKSWYFRKCTGCDLELENVAGKFVCSQKQGCGRTIPYPDKRSPIQFLKISPVFIILIKNLMFSFTDSEYAYFVLTNLGHWQLFFKTTKSTASLTKLS